MKKALALCVAVAVMFAVVMGVTRERMRRAERRSADATALSLAASRPATPSPSPTSPIGTDTTMNAPSLFGAASPAAVARLVKQGARFDEENAKGLCPIHVACIDGKRDIVRALLAAGDDVNRRTTRGATPLMWVCDASYDLPILDFLLKNGADHRIGTSHEPTWTPLFSAAGQAKYDYTRRLLEAGADPFGLDKEGDSILSYCDSEIQELIVEYQQKKQP